MLAEDVTHTLDIAKVPHEPLHLSNNGSSYITGDPAENSATKWRSNHNQDRPDMGIGSTTPTQKLQMAA
jgi:hypothetical protein